MEYRLGNMLLGWKQGLQHLHSLARKSINQNALAPPPGMCSLPSQASQSIHDGVTRLNLVYKANPSEAASESMSKEMGGFCQQMVASLT